MKATQKKIFIRLVFLGGALSFFIHGCSEIGSFSLSPKKPDSAAVTSVEDPNTKSNAALNGHLSEALVKFGLSESQSAKITAAGVKSVGSKAKSSKDNSVSSRYKKKTKKSSLALQTDSASDTIDAFVAQMEDYTGGAVESLSDSSLALTSAQRKAIVGVILQGEAKALADSTVVDASLSGDDLAGVVGVISGSAVANLKAGGYTQEEIKTQVQLVSSSSIGALTDTGLSEGLKSAALQEVVSSSVNNLSAAGVGKDDLAAYLALVNQGAVSSLSSAGFAKAAMGPLIKSISSSSLAGADGFSGLTVSDLSGLSVQVTRGIIAGASSISGFTSADLSDFARMASAGVMVGVGVFSGVAATDLADIAGSASAGVMQGASQFNGFDFAYYGDLAQASSVGMMQGSSEIPNFNKSYYDNIAKGSLKGLFQGCDAIIGFDPSLLNDISQSGANGVMAGAGAISGFDASLYGDLAKASTEGSMSGAANFTGMDAASLKAIAKASASGVMAGVGEISAFDSSLLSSLASASASGALTGLSYFAGVDQALIGSIGSAVSQGSVEGAGSFSGLDASILTAIGQFSSTAVVTAAQNNFANVSIDVNSLLSVTLSAATNASAVAQQQMTCEAQEGYSWEASRLICMPPPAATGSEGTIAAALDSQTLCINAGGSWDETASVCQNDTLASSTCASSGGAFSVASHSCVMPANAQGLAAACTVSGGTYDTDSKLCTPAAAWSILPCSSVRGLAASDLHTYIDKASATMSISGFCILGGMEQCSSFTVSGIILSTNDANTSVCFGSGAPLSGK